uniref:Putative salivary lipocalin n=1 Tax=Ixodes ricinus TaxID=34613 RepID=A0A0K8RG80_IXORI
MMKTLLLASLLSGYTSCSEKQETSVPDPAWKKSKYSDMQNISKLILMPQMGTRHYVYEGNSDDDYMLNTSYPFRCGAMIYQGKVDDGTRNAQRESKNITEQSLTENIARWVNLKPMNDTSEKVPTWMEVRDYGDTTFIFANMSLVYSDYKTCALLQYNDTDKCEVWVYQKPEKEHKPTVCELLHEYVCPNNITLYYQDGCYREKTMSS